MKSINALVHTKFKYIDFSYMTSIMYCLSLSESNFKTNYTPLIVNALSPSTYILVSVVVRVEIGTPSFNQTIFSWSEASQGKFADVLMGKV